MAFPSASGHNNLPQGNFSPEIFSQKVQKFFRTRSVVDGITNNDWYGEIANFGDSVRVINEPTVTVSDYTRGAVVNPQDLQDDDFTLVVDQAKQFSFRVDDIEEKQSHVNWTDLATSSGAYALQNSYDQAILAHIATNVTDTDLIYGAAGSGIDTGFDSGEISPLAVINRLNRFLNTNDVPVENRWFVGGPEFWEQLEDEDSKLLSWDFSEKGALDNGMVTGRTIRGFKCYMSNNLPAGTIANEFNVLAGHMSAVATASQITKVETLRSENTFADITRGLHVYGRKVTRSDALVQGILNID